jgi:hypothetical protein
VIERTGSPNNEAPSGAAVPAQLSQQKRLLLAHGRKIEVAVRALINQLSYL